MIEVAFRASVQKLAVFLQIIASLMLYVHLLLTGDRLRSDAPELRLVEALVRNNSTLHCRALHSSEVSAKAISLD